MKKKYLIFILFLILIFTSCQTKPIDFPAAKPSGLELGYNASGLTGSSFKDAPEEPVYIGSYTVPILINLYPTIDEYYNSPLESVLRKKEEDQYAYFIEAYEKVQKLYDGAVSEKNKEKEQKYKDILMRFNYSSVPGIVSEGEGYFVFADSITWSEGDGKKHFKVYTFNLDINGKNLITLPDLFKDSHYKSVLQKEIKKVISRTSIYKEKLYPDSYAPNLPNEEQYFLTAGKLVIYYNPGEIAPEKEGVVYFEIRLERLQNDLNEKFAGKSVIAVTRPSKLFIYAKGGG